MGARGLSRCPLLCRIRPQPRCHEMENDRMKRQINIVTDGSSIGNPGPGGWAAVLTCGSKRRTISGSSEWATAPRMELTAAIEALRTLESGSRVCLSSDSEYLIRGMQHLARRWRREGWRNSRGELLQDRGLWQQLLRLDDDHHIRWTWVRGHNGHPIQTEADRMAYSAARSQLVRLREAA